MFRFFQNLWIKTVISLSARTCLKCKYNHGKYHSFINFFCYRSSRPEVFYKKGVLKTFAKFAEKHLCKNLFFNKAEGWRLKVCSFIKKSCFSLNIAKFLITAFSKKICKQLLQTTLQTEFLQQSFCLTVLIKVKIFWRK